MDSDKYPKGLFKGSFSNCTTLNLAHDGEYKVEISGYLTIHGVTSPIISQASIVVKSGAVSVGDPLKYLLLIMELIFLNYS